jgi:hypothetical protein
MEKKIWGKSPSKETPSFGAKPPSPASQGGTSSPSRAATATMPPSSSGGVTVASKKAAPPTREEIAERARAIWKAGGCKTGRDEQNWFEAERQLRAERNLR